VVIFGAGGAAHGAAACLVSAGVREIRIVNRTLERAQHLAEALGPTVKAMKPRRRGCCRGAAAIVNATSLGLGGGPGPEAPFEAACARRGGHGHGLQAAAHRIPAPPPPAATGRSMAWPC
jgi:shikimate 5-dehydrogenase